MLYGFISYRVPSYNCTPNNLPLQAMACILLLVIFLKPRQKLSKDLGPNNTDGQVGYHTDDPVDDTIVKHHVEKESAIIDIKGCYRCTYFHFST